MRGRPLGARGRPEPERGRLLPATAELSERDSGAAASSSTEPSRLTEAAEALNMPLRKSRREVPQRRLGEPRGDAAAAVAAAGRRGLLTAAAAEAEARAERGRAGEPEAAPDVGDATARSSIMTLAVLVDVCLGVRRGVKIDWNGQRGRRDSGLKVSAAQHGEGTFAPDGNADCGGLRASPASTCHGEAN